MKNQKLFVIVASVCLMAFFNVSSFAQAARVSPDDAAKTLTDTLEKQGFNVNRFGSFVQFTTSQGRIVDLHFERDGVTLSVDGNGVSRRKLGYNRLGSEVPGATTEETDINIVECLLISVEVYGLKLDLCEFDTSGVDLLCVPTSTFDFALNVLRCVGNIGDGE